jgi:hypothetical protein
MRYGGGMPDESYLHSRTACPGWEYETKTGPRKDWHDEDRPPYGEGWIRNTHCGDQGWERFDTHEEAYWMRRIFDESDFMIIHCGHWERFDTHE